MIMTADISLPRDRSPIAALDAAEDTPPGKRDGRCILAETVCEGGENT